ncbi:MAG: hypothetical protein HYY96_07425 [Candidatus Tectomicrobia bacterium]|nr:hypothetical protein [Candidatus Tectomicrobia bacterium]
MMVARGLSIATTLRNLFRGGVGPRRQAAAVRVALLVAWLAAVLGSGGEIASPTAAQAQEGGSAAEAGFWSLGAPLPTPRQEVAVAALGGFVYVLGGIDAERRSVATVERYDPVRNIWELLAPLPAPRHHAAAAAVDGVLYVAGGFATLAFDAVASVYAFDPQRGAWSERAPLPTPRGAAAAAVIDNQLYVAGGFRNGSVAEAARYDPVADRWESLPPMPTARDHLAAAAIEGRLYAAGGRDNTPALNLGTLEVYDPASGRWSSGSPMPTPRSGIAAAALGGRLYVFGGESLAATFAENEAYDPASDSWSQAPALPTPRHGIGAALLDGRIYIPGGGVLAGFSTSGVTEVFTLASPAAELSLWIAPDHAARQLGQPLRLLAAAAYHGAPRTVDVYLGFAFADGSLAFLDAGFALQRPTTFLPVLRGFPLTPGFAFSAAAVADLRLAPDDPAGPALAFLALTAAGALDDASLDSGDLLGYAEQRFTLAAP